MLILFIILAVVASILLVLIILAQNPKGGGLSSSFGGSAASNIMGVRRTNDFLEKATWYLAIGIMAIVIISNFFNPEQKANTQSNESQIQENIDRDLPNPMPQQQAPQPGQPGGESQQNGGNNQQQNNQGQ